MAVSSTNKVKCTYIEEWLDEDSSVPLKVQRNISKLLEEHPEGINFTDFAKLYKKNYNVAFVPTNYEASSLLHLVSNLKNIFRQFELKGQDIILFPAFLPESEAEIKLKRDTDNTPDFVKDNMKKILRHAKSQNPKLGGIYSEDFLARYEAWFGTLEFQSYNSLTFDEFISKQLKTWLKESVIDGKSVLMYYDEEDEKNQTLYPLNLIQMVKRDKYPPHVISPHERLKKLNFNEEFKVGDKVNVCVVRSESCDRFYFQLRKYSTELDDLDAKMDSFYNDQKETVMIPKWVHASGLFCATYYTEKTEWFRVQICKVMDNSVCRCYYVDEGYFYNLKPENIYYLKKEFAELPMQAICASLAYAKPVSSCWSTDCMKIFKCLITRKPIIAEIVSIDAETPNLTVNLFADGENVLDILISEKLAQRTEIEENSTYFDIKDEEISLPSKVDGPSCELVCKAEKDQLESSSNIILTHDVSLKDDKLLKTTDDPLSILCDSLSSIPLSLDTSTHFYKAYSMPSLTNERSIGKSILKNSNSSSTDLKNSQENKLQSESKMPELVERPIRSSSTPAATQNCSNSNNPFLRFSPPSTSTYRPPPGPQLPAYFPPNMVQNRMPTRYPPPISPMHSFRPVFLPYCSSYRPSPMMCNREIRHAPPYLSPYNNNYTPFQPHFGYGAPAFYQQYCYYPPYYAAPPNPFLNPYCQPPPGFVYPSPCVCSKGEKNLNESYHGQDLMMHPPPAMETQIPVNSSNKLNGEPKQAKKQEIRPLRRRPLVESNIFEFVYKRRQENTIPLKIEIMDHIISGEVIHRVVINNKSFLIEAELITKLSDFLNTQAHHECLTFKPSRSQLPLLYEKLQTKLIGVSLTDLCLIPLTEFPRMLFEVGKASEIMIKEALVERIDLRTAMWSSDFDFSNGSKRKRRKIESQVPESSSLILKEPCTVDELVTHSRKVSEVREWLEHASLTSEMLLISGPAGSAKSMTLKLVAKSMKIEVLEWINPVDKQEFISNDWFEDLNNEPTAFKESKQLEKFEAFALRSSRYQTLFSTSPKQIVLVADFPNHFIWKPNLFIQFLTKYKKSGLCPIIFICTDDEKFNLMNTLFPNSVKECFNIHNIKFNPVSYTALLKMLQKNAGFLPKETLVDLAKKCNGDIRTALSDLKFMASDNSKMKKNIKISKDQNTDFFQILGRVLYPKRNEELTPTGQSFLYDVNTIADHYNYTFFSMIHANFLNTFSSIKDVTKACERLSDCDIFNNGCDELQCYAGLTCVIGLMSANKHPKKGKFQPMTRSKMGSKPVNNMQRLYPQFRLTNRTVNLDIIPYLKLLPSFAGSIMNAHADRLWTKNSRKVENIFKLPAPSSNTGSDEEWTIEEFTD